MLPLELAETGLYFTEKYGTKNSTNDSTNNVMMLTVAVRQLYPHTAVSKVCRWPVPGSTLFSTSAGADR